MQSHDILDVHSIVSEMEKSGFCWVGERFDTAFRQQVIDFIDAFPEEQSEINYAGTEKRIWKSHEHCAPIAEFRAFADDLLSRVYGKTVVSRDILAIRNRPVDDTPTLNRGRWHLDSLRAQIKVFLFLTEVTESTGPLELVPGSHKPAFKVRHVLDQRLVTPMDFLGSTRRYQHLGDDWVERSVIPQVDGTAPMMCEAGSAAIVNTSAIHRARPCLEGSRYALTAYYDHF